MPLETITRDNPLYSLGEELQRQLGTKRDLIADTRRTSFAEVDADWLHGAGDGSVVRPGLSLLVDLPGGPEGFSLTDHAHQQLSTHLGIGHTLYSKLRREQPDLLVHLTNGLLARYPTKRLLRLMDGKVRAFLSDSYRPRDNFDLLDQAVLPVLRDFPGRVTFKRCDLTETKLYIKIVLPDMEKPVTPKVGDVIRGGAIIQNSEVGNGSLSVFPYTDVLYCTNGMVHTEFGQRRRHVGKKITGDEETWEFFSDETLRLDDAAYFAKCADTLRGVLNETIFDRIVAQMRELAGIHIPGAPDDVIEIIADKHKLTEGERGSMLGALIDGGDRTAWGFVNAITRTARDHESPDRMTDLEIIAGRMTSDPAWAHTLAAA